MPQLYANWDFFDVESQVLPFMVGSYQGTRKVFNIGAGFQYHPDAMRHVRPRATVAAANGTTRAVLPTEAPNPAPVGSNTLPAGSPADATFNGDWVSEPMRHLAVDAFLDLPLHHDGDAVTAHTVYYDLNYGKNYVRNIGIMPVGVGNPGTRVPAGLANAGQFQFAQPGFNGGGTATRSTAPGPCGTRRPATSCRGGGPSTSPACSPRGRSRWSTSTASPRGT
jgi:hypothetical protein